VGVRREPGRVERGVEQRSSEKAPLEDAAVTQVKLEDRPGLEHHRHARRDHLRLGRSALGSADHLQQLP